MSGQLPNRGLRAVHQVAGGLCAAMCLYNLLRTTQEPNWRNATNTLVYAGAWLWEQARADDHLRLEA